MKTIELTAKQRKLGEIARLMDAGYNSSSIADVVGEPVETVERLIDWIRKERSKIGI